MMALSAQSSITESLENKHNSAPDAKVEQSPRGMFSRATTAEVRTIADKDSRISVGLFVEHEVWNLLASGSIVSPRVEESGAKTCAFNGLQKLLWLLRKSISKVMPCGQVQRLTLGMMASVSTLLLARGAAKPLRVVNLGTPAGTATGSDGAAAL